MTDPPGGTARSNDNCPSSTPCSLFSFLFNGFPQVPSGPARRLLQVGGSDEEQLQAHQVQQHLLAALHQRLLQERVQQPGAEGQRRALALLLQPGDQGGVSWKFTAR